MSAPLVPVAPATPVLGSPDLLLPVGSPKNKRQLSQAGSSPMTPGKKLTKASDSVPEGATSSDPSGADTDSAVTADVGASLFCRLCGVPCRVAYHCFGCAGIT